MIILRYSLLSSEIMHYVPDDLLNEENTKYFAALLQDPHSLLTDIKHPLPKISH
jgi:hypothetical protein